MPKVIDSALAGANAAAGPMFRTMLPCVLICAQIGAAPALADSKSSAEFMLTTCLAAMDDLAKVEAIAGKNNWTVRTSPISAAMSKFVTSKSMWEVTEAEDQFYVMTWMSHIGENLPPRKVCSVMFRGNNVNREEFFNFVSASVELTFMSDTRFPQTRSETYGVKSDRTTKLMLGITSRSDGILTMAILQEIVWFGPRLGVRVEHATGDIAANAPQAQFGTATEAKAMLVRVVAAVKADKAKALDMFAKGEGGFLDHDLYPFCFNINGGNIHPFANPNGKQFFGMDIRDTGGPIGKEEYAAAQKPEGEFTEINYSFPKPGASAMPVPKVTFVTRAGDLGCGVGYYK